MIDKTHIKPFATFLADRQYSKLAITNYSLTARKLLELVDKKENELTLEDIETYVRAMNTNINKGKPYSNNAKISKFQGLKIYIQYLNSKVLKEKIEFDKMLLHPPTPTIPEKTVLTKDEIKSILESARTNRRDSALLTTLYYSAQRKTSIQSLNISDINWDTGEVWIRHGTKQKKGIYEYKVSIKEALPVLRDYIDNFRERPKEGHEDALFLSGTGTRICGETINIILKRHVVGAGIKKRVYPHLLRATAVTLMDEAGMTPSQIVKRTGHRDTDSLKSYLMPNPEMCNQRADESLSLENPQTSKPKPEIPTIPQEPSRVEELRLQLQLKQTELELLKLKQQQSTENPSIYG